MATLFSFLLRSYSRSNPTLQATLIATVLVSGCSKADDRICGSLAMKVPDSIPLDGNRQQAAAACVERWAARLSFGPDTASEVADGALGACAEPILFAESEIEKLRDRQGSAEPATAYWRNQAIFRVVQWRAGKCPIEKAL